MTNEAAAKYLTNHGWVFACKYRPGVFNGTNVWRDKDGKRHHQTMAIGIQRERNKLKAA